MLDISRLKSGVVKTEIMDFTLTTLFEELRAEFAGVAASKGLQLSLEPSENAVRSDPPLLGQVLRNLVSNAIKYTRAGWVQLRCLSQQGFVRIEVCGTGVGIPADQLAHIYEDLSSGRFSEHRTRRLWVGIEHRAANCAAVGYPI